MPLANVQIRGFDVPAESSWERGKRQSVTAMLDREPPSDWVHLFNAEVALRDGELAAAKPMIRSDALIFHAFAENARSLSTSFRDVLLTVNISYASAPSSETASSERFAP